MSDTEEFASAFEGTSFYIPTQAGAIKKGGYCMLKNSPCKVTEFSTAKPGKHGSAKATIVGYDIFTNKKHEDGWPTSHTIRVPVIKKNELKVVDVDDDYFVSFEMDDGTLKQDLKLPDEIQLRNELMEMWNQSEEQDKTLYYTVIQACGKEKIVSGRSQK